MSTDSRKAQRNSYAHHRAHLLFSGLQSDSTTTKHPTSRNSPDISLLTQRVRAGIIGFVRNGAATQLNLEALTDA
jgi:hypothetical protein